MPFKFVLVKSGSPQPVVENNLSLSPKGITKINLPQSIKLEPQTIYTWYVVIPCEQINNENSQEILNSSLEFVPPSPEELRSSF
jgi:hypothetical protein